MMRSHESLQGHVVFEKRRQSQSVSCSEEGMSFGQRGPNGKSGQTGKSEQGAAAAAIAYLQSLPLAVWFGKNRNGGPWGDILQ